jgi:excisionase family DNA binding protein
MRNPKEERMMSAPAAGLIACPRCGWSDALTVPEAAEHLGTSDQTIRNWIKLGRLPGVVEEKIPGGFRYWIPRSSLDALRDGAA